MRKLDVLAIALIGLLQNGPSVRLVAQEPAAVRAKAETPVRSQAEVAKKSEPPKVVATQGGLTPHFIQWLKANGHGAQNFERSDLEGGSYGGKQGEADPVRHKPIIFIHGNSDRALGTGSIMATGWNASIDYFASKGYTSSELYATTWGLADSTYATTQYHSKAYLTRLRAFILAVKAYTGAPKVDIVAHSMGVTLARKAIKGGAGTDPLDGGPYQLGAPLTSIVDTFVGISGGNWGLVGCEQIGDAVPICSSTNGFYPGRAEGPVGLSAILQDLNSAPHFEGAFVYSIWSKVDELIGGNNLVWGRSTSRIPGQDGEKTFDAEPYGHVNSKDLTGYHQWRMVQAHATD